MLWRNDREMLRDNKISAKTMHSLTLLTFTLARMTILNNMKSCEWKVRTRNGCCGVYKVITQNNQRH